MAEVASVVAGRIDVAFIEEEPVGKVSTRAGPRRPIITEPASVLEG